MNFYNRLYKSDNMEVWVKGAYSKEELETRDNPGADPYLEIYRVDVVDYSGAKYETLDFYEWLFEQGQNQNGIDSFVDLVEKMIKDK